MQNTRIAMYQEQYQKEFDELVECHSRVKQEYEEQAIVAKQDVFLALVPDPRCFTKHGDRFYDS